MTRFLGLIGKNLIKRVSVDGEKMGAEDGWIKPILQYS